MEARMRLAELSVIHFGLGGLDKSTRTRDSGKGFGQGITPRQSSFLHGFAHVFRLERSGGRPLDRARLQALVPTLTSQTIIDAGEKLKEMQEIREGPQPQFADMVLGEGFYQWQIAFQTMLSSSVIGAYWIPIVYLTVPLVINTANLTMSFGPQCHYSV
ncbi:hypothetical protein THAOC_37553 [Thalassiosira oceanica]|uniref:Uncharacterized protein n=1 Tax=Thalassiosira oceanica TaxID=159749 RepID=K0QYA5_THAOC|nr:hypothetical protein THAOC_37553 [Thalassiosira oceanica]|eukprot:EJK43953.1 hypothetical protein THAOC_37553 [Thalassiosira oceanica]